MTIALSTNYAIRVERAIRAGTILKRYIQVDPLTKERKPRERVNLEDLPKWVETACLEGRIFLNPEDEYRFVWLDTPYITREGRAIFVVAGPKCILMDRDGEVVCLAEADWEDYFSDR